VAFSTENWDIHLVCSGLDVGGRKDVVFSVTFITGWGVRSSALQSSTMYSRVKILISHIMADAAVHFFKSFGMRELFNVCIHVAGCAVQVFVNRVCIFLKVHIERNSPALPFGSEIRILMTYRTVFIRLRREKRSEE
jgi:hypothetical protein